MQKEQAIQCPDQDKYALYMNTKLFICGTRAVLPQPTLITGTL